MASVAQLLTGRLALITGGGSGIGRAVCIALAREGAKVVVSDIDKDAAETTVKKFLGEDKHVFKHVDVTSAESVTKLFTQVHEECGAAPQILVNCAGITRDAFMWNMTEKMFDDVISVNLKGTYLMTQTASRLMIQDKISDGSIINVSSVVGKVGNMGQCNYAASKAGVEGFTKSVAKEMAKYGIRCNAVMPGFIDTPMVATVPGKVIDAMIQQIPLGRMGKPEEIADACTYLASSRSSYITGTIIQVSGGLYV